MRLARLREDLAGYPGPLMVELLFAAEPSPARQQLSKSVGHRLGTSVTANDGGSKSSAVVLSFAGEASGRDDPDVVPRIALLGPVASTDHDRYETAIGRSDWGGARVAVVGASCSLLITDLAASGLPIGERIRRLEAVVAAAVDATQPVALYWPGSEVIVDPVAYRAAIDRDPA